MGTTLLVRIGIGLWVLLAVVTRSDRAEIPQIKLSSSTAIPTGQQWAGRSWWDDCRTIQRASPPDSLLDRRDGRWYSVVRVDSLYWFNEPLAFATPHSVEIVSGLPMRKHRIRLYAFDQAQTACPDGWRLPTVSEFDQLIQAITDTIYLGLTTLEENWETINDNPVGFHFEQGGFLHKKRIKSPESFNLWLAPSDRDEAYHVHLYDTNRRDHQDHLTVFRHTHDRYNPKKNRKFAIRCVCEINIRE